MGTDLLHSVCLDPDLSIRCIINCPCSKEREKHHNIQSIYTTNIFHLLIYLNESLLHPLWGLQIFPEAWCPELDPVIQLKLNQCFTKIFHDFLVLIFYKLNKRIIKIIWSWPWFNALSDCTEICPIFQHCMNYIQTFWDPTFFLYKQQLPGFYLI